MRKEIQVVFQDPLSSLSPRLTVEQIIGEGLEIHEPALDQAGAARAHRAGAATTSASPKAGRPSRCCTAIRTSSPAASASASPSRAR